jgi:LytS/YehU family sensor histidine kinase
VAGCCGVCAAVDTVAIIAMRVGAIVLVVWLVIGAIAGAQRHYYNGSIASCTKASTILVTILAGPLNYVGVNPKVHCHVPQPSK